MACLILSLTAMLMMWPLYEITDIKQLPKQS